MKKIVGVKKRYLGDSWSSKKKRKYELNIKKKKKPKGMLLWFDNSATLKAYKNKY